MNYKAINTAKRVYPQIYAYTLPEDADKQGWQKIGYTERQNVEDRILEQTKTPAINLKHRTLWRAPAFFKDSQEFFNDKEFHRYLTKHGIPKDQGHGTEWFYFNGQPDRSYELFQQFSSGQVSSSEVKSKLSYVLRQEQAQAVKATLDYAALNHTTDFSNPNPKASFLWNAKPRFGKTLTSYDFAKQFQAQKVLIVTNRPAIANSWFDDYEAFVDGYEFVSTADSLSERPSITYGEYQRLKKQQSDKKLIVFLSLQDLKGAQVFGGKYNKLEYVADIEWDLLIIDEAHEAVDTEKTDQAFANIKRRFTLHLSGTPFKQLANNKFNEKQIFNWTYLDEQLAKQFELESGDDAGPHVHMPDLRLFTYKMSDILVDRLEYGMEDDYGQRIDYAFDLNEFFATKNGKFEHEADVLAFLDALTRNQKYPFSTPELRNELKHTFWLVGNRVASAKAMEKILRSHPVFSQYEIILAAGDGRRLTDEAESEIEASDELANQKSFDRVRRAVAKHDKTITLSVGQLTTGVTIPEWTAVLMLSDIKAEALYTQAIFRAQNPYKKIESDGHFYRKHSAYVFDFSPNRVLEVYDKFANSLAQEAATGQITEEQRTANVARLLNYFPVIAEDESGQMIELNAEQVLTFPKAIIAKEVVNRGFITNLLFVNVNSVFNIPQEVISSLNKAPSTNETGRDDKKVNTVEHDAERGVKRERRISVNKDRLLGNKVYSNQVNDIIKENLERFEDKLDIADGIISDVQDQILEPVYSRWIEVYRPSQKEQQQVKQQHLIKIKEITESFIDQGLADLSKVVDQLAIVIEHDLPNDLVVREEQEEFEKEEKTELDQIRSKLRTFTRAIPSFIMASQIPDQITIDNIEDTVSDEDFQELFSQSGEEPFTKDDFRKIRGPGTYMRDGQEIQFDGFFDRYTFNAAIKEFERMRQQLADYLNDDTSRDIFSYIRPLKTNQIFTPRRVVNQMLDLLEKHNPQIFSNPNLKFADLYVKSGLYLTEIAKRLNRGLYQQIPDRHQRIKHIFEHQLYGFAPTSIIYNIARKYIFSGFDYVDDRNLIQRDLTVLFKKGEQLEMKFDIVIGNPPYQENDNGQREDGSANASAKPMYHLFIEGAIKSSDIQCFVIPSRWAMGAGKGLSGFNEKMLTDKHIQYFTYFSDSKEVFPNNDIKGGICYFVRNRFHTGEAQVVVKTTDEKIKTLRYLDSEQTGVFIPYVELADILKKVKVKTPDLATQNLQKIVSVRKPYGLSTDFFRNQSKYHLPPIYDHRQNPDDLQIFGLFQNKRAVRYAPRDYPVPVGRGVINRWKVFIPKAYGCGAIGEVVPSPILGSPIQICTETYLRIGNFKTEAEARALLKYIKTKFLRAMVGILKTTQDAPNRVYGLVPLQDFTDSSDIDWSKTIAEIDQQLYQKYDLSSSEIDFIESKIKDMQ